MFTVTILSLALSALSATRAQQESLRPAADHHQHFFSPSAAKLSSGVQTVAAADLLKLLDDAGIQRAIVLSLGYQYGNPNRPAVPEEHTRVREENDWTSRQVATAPDRLRGFCGLNPLKDYALDELARCAKDPHLRYGLKLHFGNSDVDLQNSEHVDRLRGVFQAANRYRMAVIVHLRSSVSRKRPYGAPAATAFLDRIMPAAGDMTVQIAHLAGSGGYEDAAADEAIGVFVDAVAQKDPRMTHVYFDVSGVAGLGNWQEKADLIARRIRQLGVERILYGSDGSQADWTPAKAWTAFRQLPLTGEEFRRISANLAPYLR